MNKLIELVLVLGGLFLGYFGAALVTYLFGPIIGSMIIIACIFYIYLYLMDGERK